MKIVFTCGIRTLPGRPYPLPDLYRDHLEEAVLAEELGFDCVWVSEHHFSPDCWNPAPFAFLGAIAARTERVRIGTYVLLLPLHNPVRVAEDVAVLDNISRGRVDLGVGVGSSPGSSAPSASRSRTGSAAPSRRCASSSAASPPKNSATQASTTIFPTST
jgi:alkanesulfonate monooxygenase SsuD/methylene tetrahydromethanopterin reductase-like flavin-dependent oxidoreductase (luciferase family)